MSKKRFSLGWHRYKADKGKWEGQAIVRVTKVTHALLVHYATEHKLELREAADKLIGIGLATEMGYTIENFHTET